MAKQNDVNFYVSSSSREHDSEKSFVKKVKSRVSDLIPASISKWFGSEDNSGRSREDDDDIFQVEPPLKRARIPSKETNENNLSNNFTTTPHIHYAPVSGFDVISDNCVSINNKKASKRMLNSFSEPEAGPSGIKSRKLLIPSGVTVQTEQRKLTETNINGDKNSDSDESTSDYSSMARNGSREATISKRPHIEEFKAHGSNPGREIRERSVISQTRSLFSERGVSPHSNSSLSSRRPSFNASTFGSPDFVDRTLTTKRIINSPFYGGRTTYGGASAYSHRLKKNADIKNSIRNAFEVKPANESVKTENATLSKTARRILDTLEQYTTPVSEAKKIPNPSLRRGGTTKRDGLLSKYTGANPYFVREPKNTPSNKELQVPTVPELLKMKLKEKLQDSTVAVRQIAATSKAAQNADEYKLRDKDDEQTISKHVNKMRNKVSNVRKRTTGTLDQEKIEHVKLPDIALPITTLPKFDFGILPTNSAPATVTKAVTTTSTRVVMKETKTETDEGTKTEKQVTKISITNESKKTTSEEPKQIEMNDMQFKFAKPVVLLSNNLKSIIGSNDFVFSKPLNEKEEVQKNFKSSSGKYELKRKSQGGMNFIQTAKMDLMSAFKPPANTWECNVCLIRNVQDREKCAACQAERAFKLPVTATATVKSSDFGNKFKLTSDMWECKVCMVRNKNNDTKCVACTTPKPATDNSASLPTNDGFGDKFKPPSDTWVCDVCMIRNKNELDKCAACESPNPNAPQKTTSFADAFKIKKNEWECPSCMVRNPETKSKCVCCETLRPGHELMDKSVADNKSTMSTFNFGINDAVGVVTSKGFTFGIPKDLRETEKTVPTPGFTFGESNEKNVPVPNEIKPVLFNGTANNKKDTEASESNNNSKLTFGFGITSISSATTPSLKSVSTVNSTETKVTSSATITTTPSFGFTAKTVESLAPSSFVFDVSTVKKSDSKTLNATSEIPTPILGQVSEKKSDSSASITSTMFANKADSSTTKTNTVPASASAFKSPTTISKPSSSIFGTSAKPDSSTSMFGAPTTKAEASVPVFGSSTFGKSTPVAFGTTKPDSSTPSIFGSSDSTGGVDNNQKSDAIFKFGTAPTQATSFGGASSSFQTTPFITSSIPAPTFVMPVTSSTTGQGAFSFGQDTSAKPYNQGQPQATEVAKSAGGFSFEQENKQQQEQKFNFGSNSTSSAGFSFGSGFNFKPMFDSSQQQSQQQQQQQQNTSIFGNSSAAAASAVIPQQLPQLLQNGGFNFGNVPPKGGFNFAPQPTASSAPGVFSFGGASTNAVPEASGSSGGFNFGSAQFNANVKPNFNFSGAAPPTFSATPDPSSSVPAGRKKIKAVRRNQQR